MYVSFTENIRMNISLATFNKGIHLSPNETIEAKSTHEPINLLSH